MGCNNGSCGCACSCKDGSCFACKIKRVLKLLIMLVKFTVLLGLTLVLFDIHSGLRAQFEGMQAQQAMMMAAPPAAAPASNK